MKWFSKNRDHEKQVVISGTLSRIFDNHLSFSHAEQTEILNRVMLNVLERKKDTRQKLIQEARELQNSIKELKL